MPDYSVEFLDAGEGVLSDDTVVGKANLITALHQIAKELKDNPDYPNICGLNIREVDASD